ncbi:class I SAM-dependent methyltransferase [Stakelama marina]|uniref:Class I SAM-dependent methyltransferase n=1 Tax=Stakelama marina TaxID=2826939 RepID=A0A8T4IGA2_9SPHN|nr:class I SAM-dependent methyltransferase [Stakelama marina]MBR0551256.1 class I SAM-dependent methyltransferase [Stakelama marina]
MGETPSSSDWAGERGEKWRDQLDGLEAMLEPVNAPLIAALRPEGAMRIADIACGGGATTRAIAEHCGTGAQVFGFDISPALVEAARERSADMDRPPLFDVADSSALQVERPFDRVVSRFGTMFFADPPAAFRNIAALVAPQGRFSFAVWGPPQDNAWMATVREAVTRFVEVPAPEPDAPGPFRYADPTPLIAMLREAGLHDVTVEDWRNEIALGGGLPAAKAADFALASMSVGQLIEEADEAAAAKAREALVERFAAAETTGGVTLPARVHIISGTA